MALNIDKILEARIQKQNRLVASLQSKLDVDSLLADDRYVGLLGQSVGILLELIDSYREPRIPVYIAEDLDESLAEGETYPDEVENVETELTA